MKTAVVAFVVGVIFAMGLGIAGMTNPEKVMDFLDVTGHWDPSLALVMLSAIATHAVGVALARRARKPLWGDAFDLPKLTSIDVPLIAGAALFGFGWGAVGYCPGPALVSLVGLGPPTVTFVAAMVAGMSLYSWAWPTSLGGVKRRNDIPRPAP
ncbi:MAG: DUF6691 family protein [Polyangiaceae bacterium]